MRWSLPLLVALALALSACGIASGAEDDVDLVSQQGSPGLALPDDLRDFRYCEVLAMTRSGLAVEVEVYNTMGQSDCPPDQWNRLDAEQIAEQYDFTQAFLNGPRHWVLNEVTSAGVSSGGRLAEFGDLEMRLVAEIELRFRDLGGLGLGGLQAPYEQRQVARDTTYAFWEGTEVYELVASSGDVYRMQSYSQVIDPDLTIDDLSGLGDRLDLPGGWSFRTSVLAAEEIYTVDSVATVVVDELGNTYQLVEPAD